MVSRHAIQHYTTLFDADSKAHGQWVRGGIPTVTIQRGPKIMKHF